MMVAYLLDQAEAQCPLARRVSHLETETLIRMSWVAAVCLKVG